MSAKQDTAAVSSTYPHLQPQLEISPLVYRHERWYLLRNASNMTTIRLSETAYAAVTLMDGEHNLQEIVAISESRYAADAPTHEELLHLLVQLDRGNFLLSGLPEQLQTLSRKKGYDSGRWNLKGFSPTAVRIPLWNPEQRLDRCRVLAQWFVSPRFLFAWFLFIGCCIPLAFLHIDDIKNEISSDFWTPEHALLLVIIYVVIKFIHELSHALAIKGWGGEVREVGIMLLWFFPCPYVDGSAAAFFPDKYKRAFVAAAGVMAEMTLAAIALLIFITVEPSVIRTLALDIMLIGAVSTVIANGNPLLKFDGYYVLEDLIEVPNLATRSQRYYLYLVQRYLFGLHEAQSPKNAEGEHVWFMVYAPLALIYRIILVLTIALLFSKRYLVAGVLVALFALFNQLLMPLYRGTKYLAMSPRLQARRMRALVITSGSFLSFTLFISLVPVSTNTNAEGVVGSAKQSVIYSQTEGFIREFLSVPFSRVTAGQALLRIENTELTASMIKLKARRKELEIKRTSAFWTDRVDVSSVNNELQAIDDEIDMLENLLESLILRSEVDGKFVPVEDNRLIDQFVEQGHLLAHVISDDARVITAVVTQAEVGQIRSGFSSAHIRLVEDPTKNLLAKDVREIPGGNHHLPSASLGMQGGGRLSIDSGDSEGKTAVSRTFKIELALPENQAAKRLGGRAYVRFDHKPEPVISHISRSVEQLLLRHFGV